MTKKYLSMLGMARRAGKLSMGHDMAVNSIRNKTATLVVFACDVSPRLIREFDNELEKNCPNLPKFQLPESIAELHSALGYKAGVITVDDNNFSKRVIELINEEN